MLCDECGQNPASIHLTTIVGGEKQEHNLCASCLAKYQKQVPGIDVSSLAGLLSGFLSAAKAGNAPTSAPDIKCSRCGQTYEAFQKTGLLGCANCYNDFRKPLEALLNRIHGHTQHAGRLPCGERAEMTVKLNLEALKQRLVKAIAAEEYEEAASLRDQIRDLQAKISGEEASHE